MTESSKARGGLRALVPSIIALAFAVCATFALAGCATSGGAATTSASSATSGGAEHKIAMILDDGINDGGWGASCYNAMVSAAEKLGWDTAYSENLGQSDWATALQNYADEGYDLIFAPSDKYEDAVQQVAADNPDSKFVVLDGDIKSDNIESLLPDNRQLGELAGSLAALLTKTDSVAFIGGVELDTTKQKQEGFEAAVRQVNPAAQVTVAYAGSYTDVAKGKELAQSMVSQANVDVIFGDASGVDSGVRETLSGQEGRYNIGQPDDLGGADDPVIANSIVTDNEAMLEESMKDVENGSFGNKVIDGDLSSGAIKVGTFSDKIVPKDVQDKFAEIVKQIEAGTFIS